MIKVRWKLRDVMAENRVSVALLSAEMNGKRLPTLYRLTSPNNTPDRVDLATLEAVLDTLRRITGKPLTVGDLLETVEVTDTASTVPQSPVKVTRPASRSKVPRVRPTAT